MALGLTGHVFQVSGGIYLSLIKHDLATINYVTHRGRVTHMCVSHLIGTDTLSKPTAAYGESNNLEEIVKYKLGFNISMFLYENWNILMKI